MIEMPSEWPWALGCVLGASWVLQNICLGSRAGVINLNRFLIAKALGQFSMQLQKLLLQFAQVGPVFAPSPISGASFSLSFTTQVRELFHFAL